MILTGFSPLDTLTGGLEEGKAFLLYGDVGTGKTTFGLQFLYQGLVNGETAALVTRRSARDVFEQGLAFSMDLEPFARSENLIIFEYSSQVIENAMRVKEHEEIPREILYLLGSSPVTRLVFDPISPLLASPSTSVSVFRGRTLVHSFAELNATCLYLVDTPEGEEHLSNFKDFVYGTARFEAGEINGTGRLVLERFPGLKGRGLQVNYEISPGAGMVELVAGSAAVAPAQRKIVVIEPRHEEMKELYALLGKEYLVLAAASAADGMAKLAAENPDLLIVAKQAGDLDGVEICRTLRQNRMNIPVIVIAPDTRRLRDRVEVMTAGADELLCKPLDGRILKLKVQNLLRRYEAARDRYSNAPLISGAASTLERDKTTETGNLAYFFERVRQEIVYSSDNSLSLAVLALHLPSDPVQSQEIRAIATKAIREYDLLYHDKDRVAMLLAESDEKGVSACLKRFEEAWKRPMPRTTYRCFARQPDFLQTARAMIDTATGMKAAS